MENRELLKEEEAKLRRELDAVFVLEISCLRYTSLLWIAMTFALGLFWLPWVPVWAATAILAIVGVVTWKQTQRAEILESLRQDLHNRIYLTHIRMMRMSES